MEMITEKNIISEATVNVVDKKLLEAEELEARDGQYYNQKEMDKFFAKYENV